MSSLQDQLLKAGLVNEKKSKQAKKEKAKQAKVQRKSSQPIVNETKEAVKKAQADKASSDRALNAIKREEAEKKAVAAQIIQLIKLNKLRKDGELAYNFKDGTTIKKIFVNTKMQDQLSNGRLAIAKLGDSYEVVPAVVADKIIQRDESAIISQIAKSQEVLEEDDPYADYAIPDDLMW